jgi:hypothetical protein
MRTDWHIARYDTSLLLLAIFGWFCSQIQWPTPTWNIHAMVQDPPAIHSVWSLPQDWNIWKQDQTATPWKIKQVTPTQCLVEIHKEIHPKASPITMVTAAEGTSIIDNKRADQHPLESVSNARLGSASRDEHFGRVGDPLNAVAEGLHGAFPGSDPLLSPSPLLSCVHVTI